MNVGISANYEHLFTMGDRVKKMEEQDIEMILLRIADQDGKVQNGRKWIIFETRRLNQDDYARASELKANAHLGKLVPLISGLSVLCAMGGAFAGGATSTLGGILTISGQGLDATGRHVNQFNDSKSERYNHRYQTIGSFIGDRGQMLQETRREEDKAIDLAKTVSDRSQRTFELMVSNT